MQDYIANNLTTKSTSQFTDIFDKIKTFSTTDFPVDTKVVVYHYWNTVYKYIKNKQIQDEALEKILDYGNAYKMVLFSTQPTAIEEYPWVQDMLFYSNRGIYAGLNSNTKLVASELPLEVNGKLISWFGFWPFKKTDLQNLKDLFLYGTVIPVGHSGDKYMVVFKIWDEQYKPLNVKTVSLRNTNQGEQEVEQGVSATIPSHYNFNWTQIALTNAWKKIWKPVKDEALHMQEYTKQIPDGAIKYTLIMKVIEKDRIEFEMRLDERKCDPGYVFYESWDGVNGFCNPFHHNWGAWK